MKDPIYFTENQSGGINPHSSIPPEASTLIIKKHVTDGLELGKHLPRTIRDFITTHHGTSKTGYFYITYKNAHPDEEVDDQFFSYPGPKPFTREQAILMFADSVEAAARSIKEYNDQNIDEKVETIVNGKINSGELSDCPLTLREISIIKEVFKKRLKDIHHTRISYPTENKPAAPKQEQQS
jgi:membrane-associated HD superfamily phosphohydrolase